MTPAKRMMACPACKQEGVLEVSFDEHGCARWGTCRSCGGDGPFTPCQECTKDPKPCK